MWPGLAVLLPFLANFPISPANAIDNLRVAFQWKQVEYAWPDNDTRLLFPAYKKEDNVPLGLEVAGDRLFITVPRWKLGVAASLNYISLNDTRESPPLNPYPSWAAHQYGAFGIPEVVSTFRIRADRCGRLWVLDTGLVDILTEPEQQAPPALIVYDLANDQIIRKYVIPADQRTTDSLFANIVVEDYSCEDSFAYLGDLGGPGLVVYSWKENRSWLVKHHFFHPDPQGGEFLVAGVTFHWTDGIFGMALAPTGDGYSTLYFHPLSSTMEFAVSTQLLRDPDRSTSPKSFHEFQALGSRGPNGQSSVSFLDPATGILIYALTNLNAIACWKTGTTYNIQQQGRVYMNNVTMVFPNDLKIDQNGNIWVLSDRLPVFMYSELNPEEYNFRILTGSAREAVQGTVCSMKPAVVDQSSPSPNIQKMPVPVLTNRATGNAAGAGAGVATGGSAGAGSGTLKSSAGTEAVNVPLISFLGLIIAQLAA
ncbi:protein yellow [Cephus cinctus]|uniref:Protein yellow n=1 Tax=Cephus cinctus TaxID=211228 RepID=A0AAJ7W2D0_CEPCN|nr:protein yellow [Cephus cinctus]XP_015597383.1 protein yellow [Cephus cinctus]XP_024941856.1 protein yellow [Cephus cinctus]